MDAKNDENPTELTTTNPNTTAIAQARHAARMRKLSYLNNQSLNSSKLESSKDSLVQENELTERSQKIIEFSKQIMV